MKSTREPITYDELKPGSRLIRSNTRATENEDGTFNIYLHDNLIAILYFEGSVRVYSAGYRTVTTKQRLNNLLSHTNWRIYQTNFKWEVWKVTSSRLQEIVIPFQDGMLLSP